MVKFLLDNPIVPVYFENKIEKAIAIVQASYEAGLMVFEFTNRGNEAYEVFKSLRKYTEANCSGLKLGIGTISKGDEAQKFIDIGADFIVQPGTTREVAKVCHSAGKMWIPGVMTPTEIYSAQDLGADIVKIFPASVLGPDYIKALRGPMPQLNIMVTGGIEPTADSVKSWFESGANILGIGSKLFANATDLNLFKNTISTLLSLKK